VFSTAPRTAWLATHDRRGLGATAKLRGQENVPLFPSAACELLAGLHRALDGYPEPQDRNQARDDDFSAVEFFTPNLFILTGEPHASPVYQLAGSAIQRHLGCNPADLEFCGFWESQARPALMRHFHIAHASRRAFYLSSTLRTPDSILLLSTLLLPVAAEEAGKARLIGLSLAEYRPVSGPDSGTGRQQLRHIAFVQPDQAPSRANNS
jgi:hypothetical protein